MHVDLTGQVALVTGSATGLGHACAEAFSRAGADVALASSNLDDLAYASDRLHALGEGDVFSLESDIRDPSNVAALVDHTVEQYGGIDHLVTGPRQPEPDALLEVEDEDWFRAFDRNFMSVVWACREAYPQLDASPHGTVTNVTSPAIPALADDLAIASSFAGAVEAYTRTMARRTAPSVRVNAVIPGPHESEDLERVLADLVESGRYEGIEEAWAAVMADAPYDEPGDPLDLGRFVAFLVSEHANFVNGATIAVDGGSSV